MSNLDSRRPRTPQTPSRLTGQEARLLLQGDPEEVLARLTEGDPLEVRAFVGRRLRERWLVLEADRVQLRALALLAHEGGTWPGRPRLGPWLADLVDRAIDEVLREGAGEDASVAGFGEPLGLSPAIARRLPWVLAAQAEPERRAFVRAVLDGVDLERLAEEEGVRLNTVARRARVVLEALLAEGVPQ